MSFYQKRVVPYLIHASMRQEVFAAYRRRLAAAASGSVLEVGVGSGLNIRYYGDEVTRLIGLDPSPKLLAMARDAARLASRPIETLEASAEALPLEDATIDTVVTAWTLCSVANVSAGLQEIRRVLKPHGRLLFVEHGRSPEPKISAWQDRLTPLWKRMGGGCHLNRQIGALIEDAGFHIEQITTGYMRGPRPMTFMFEGRAARP